MIRIWTGVAAQLGSCDHCDLLKGQAPPEPQQVITAVTLHQRSDIVFLARFCQKHFLQFSDVVSDQVAALLYPARKAHQA
jgi:hypothetical protein